jgi:mRNA interferase MazF
VTRGEVWWGDHPDAERRPYLILTREAAVPLLTRLVVIPATRRRRGIPTEVELTVDDGMPADSVLTLDNVATIPKAFLTERICRLGPDRMHEVCTALAIATGCS